MSVLIILQHQRRFYVVLERIVLLLPNIYIHVYIPSYFSSTRLALRYFPLDWPAIRVHHGTCNVRARWSRACTRLKIMPIFLPFIPALCPLREITNYAGSYARIIAVSLETNGFSQYRNYFADFAKKISFKSYGVICSPRAAPAS